MILNGLSKDGKKCNFFVPIWERIGINSEKSFNSLLFKKRLQKGRMESEATTGI